MDEIIKKSSSFDDKNIDAIKNQGVVFTSYKICMKMIRQVKPSIDDVICEPSMGKGVFVFCLLEYFRENGASNQELLNFVENNLFLYEINLGFINEFKSLLGDYFNKLNIYNINPNITNSDFLLSNDKFDLVIGNPPYVKIQNIDKEKLNTLKEKYETLSNGNIDLYYAFIEKALKVSNRVCLITPNTFIKSKSSRLLRSLMKDRISKIFDFGVNKVWKNISTYTCIFICESESNYLEYKNKNTSIKIPNNKLGDDWNIFEKREGENKLYDIINNHIMSIQTSANKVFLLRKKIDEDICKKYIKATKSKNINDYGWLIYPYENENPIGESELREKYPKCFEILNNNKGYLENRNMSKGNKWYEYGRRQGLIKEPIGDRVLVPNVFKKSKGINYIIIPKDEEILPISGIIIDTNNLEEIIKILKSSNFIEYCENNNKTLPDSDPNDIWLSINTTTLKKYTY